MSSGYSIIGKERGKVRFIVLGEGEDGGFIVVLAANKDNVDASFKLKDKVNDYELFLSIC